MDWEIHTPAPWVDPDPPAQPCPAGFESHTWTLGLNDGISLTTDCAQCQKAWHETFGTEELLLEDFPVRMTFEIEYCGPWHNEVDYTGWRLTRVQS